MCVNCHLCKFVSREWQWVEDDPRKVPGYKRRQHELCLSPQSQRPFPCRSPGRRHHWPHPGAKMFPIWLPQTPPPAYQQRRPGNQLALHVRSGFPCRFDPELLVQCPPLSLLLKLFSSPASLQFDLNFVEVHRVRRFRFTPRHCQSDSDLELDLRENGKHQIFSQICRDHPACGCTPAYSSWNCDGEILTHTAIDVRYRSQRGVFFFFFYFESPSLVSLAEFDFSVSQSALPVDQTVCTRDWRANRLRGSRQPLCNIDPHPDTSCQTLESSPRGTFAFWRLNQQP